MQTYASLTKELGELGFLPESSSNNTLYKRGDRKVMIIIPEGGGRMTLWEYDFADVFGHTYLEVALDQDLKKYFGVLNVNTQNDGSPDE